MLCTVSNKKRKKREEELMVLVVFQERRAFVFCKEDRAIFCGECDVPIHKANEHTQKHNRFLLTGVKLHASSSSLYPASSSSNGCDVKIDSTEIRSSRPSIKRPKTHPKEVITPTYTVEENRISDTVSISTSSISEYLMETLPGWGVEDFLEPSIATNGFCKVCSTAPLVLFHSFLTFYIYSKASSFYY
jgi:hypothetical protein